MGSKVTNSRLKAIIALGGNLPFGDMLPRNTLEGAVEELTLPLGESCQVSRLFQTPSFPAGSGPDYINAVMVLETDLNPTDLLQHLHEVEQKFSRQRDQRWGMRTLDLDLIALGDWVLPDRPGYQRWLDLPLERQMTETPNELILPHPRVQDRAFVLVPLCDVFPDWVHPILGKTAAELCAERPKTELEAIVPV
ncbi:2-amino-4-hydroxy-6-hydroxymethyldihydropteridine diphosphokinase [Pseudophaeobacter leonis]|uniref:2-amino-4-hydroxy-6- hydroxymethyldihydropteridine diphosphokinase n=1 Tax=Pseudophaeobacter leonis TaxID=1144477 RepID=UPI001571320F|nr:2-amino-4-hydroxy-6-hydroxymethyldihydropteridine diphosphokinase [Pseudophaeobacter leonis]